MIPARLLRFLTVMYGCVVLGGIDWWIVFLSQHPRLMIGFLWSIVLLVTLANFKTLWRLTETLVEMGWCLILSLFLLDTPLPTEEDSKDSVSFPGRRE